jgi:hypothetical protein
MPVTNHGRFTALALLLNYCDVVSHEFYNGPSPITVRNGYYADFGITNRAQQTALEQMDNNAINRLIDQEIYGRAGRRRRMGSRMAGGGHVQHVYLP